MFKLVAFLLLCTVVWGFPHEGEHHQEQRNRSAPDLLALSDASSEFFQSLYAQLIPEQGFDSAVFSPLSIHLILSLTSAGAREQTAREMRSVLNLDRLNVPVSDNYRLLMKELNINTSADLLLANALYLKPGLNIERDFLRIARQDYNATVDNINLDAPGGPEKPINEYVEEQTRGNIKDMLQPGSIDGSTALLLINTLFFNSTWRRQFNPNDTQPADFHSLNDSYVKVDMMRDERVIPYKRDRTNDVAVIELAFRDQEYKLYVAMPTKEGGFPDLEKLLTSPEKFKELLQGLEERSVDLQLPRFKIEKPYKLNAVLAQLGMPTAFDPKAANFSGMVTGDGPLHITDVDHKATIEVQETGTVAAASTVVTVGFRSLVPAPEKFIADHPFLFFLKHEPTQQIIIQGRFTGN